MIGIGLNIGNRVINTGGGLNPDAQAFITATGITDATEISAINTLVNDLQGYGLWTKMKAIYPFVGGTSTTCKYNLKDPRDLDAAFRLVFNGGWTFASTGATPNGTNGYADTKLNPNSILTTNSTHLSTYCRTNQYPYSSVPSQVAIGSCPSSYDPLMDLELNGGGANNNKFVTYQYDFTTGFLTVANTDTRGFLISNRPLSNSLQIWRNGSKIASNSSTTGGMPSFNLYLSALNYNGTANNYSNFQTAFASIGDGLTDTEASNFYTSVQTFQTTLNRQVI